MTSPLLIATVVLSLLVVATIAGTATRKVVADRQERRRQQAIELVRPAVFEFLASDGIEQLPLADLVRAADPRTRARMRRAAVSLLLEFAGKVRGELLEELRGFLVSFGFAREAATDLTSRDPWVRALAAQQLGFVGDEAYLDVLLPLLDDQDRAVRIVAARSLGRIGDPRAAAPLLARRDTEREVPYGVVAHALLKIGVDATPTLVEGLRHPSFRVRRVAVDVLGQMRAPGVLPDLVALVRTDRDTLVRIRAANAVGRLGTSEVLGELYDSSRAENADIRQSLIRAIAEIGAPSSLPVLRRALADADHATARVAAYALIDLGPSGVAILQAAAGSAGRESVYAIEALDRDVPVPEEWRLRVRAWVPGDGANRPWFPGAEVTAR